MMAFWEGSIGLVRGASAQHRDSRGARRFCFLGAGA